MSAGQDEWPAEAAGEEPGVADTVGEETVVRPAIAGSRTSRRRLSGYVAHEVSHCPYRAWCRSCIAGRGLSDPHSAIDHREDAIPTIAVDYAYLGEQDDDEKASPLLPLLILKDSRSRFIGSEVLPSKGTVHRYSVDTLVRMCVAIGWPVFFLKSDQEPAIVNLKEVTIKVLIIVHGKTVTREVSAVAESQSNGLAENVVRQVKGLVGTLRRSVEEMHGVTIGSSHPILPRIVRHAGAMLTRGQRGIDGRTPFEVLKGKPYRKALPTFGGHIMYLPVGKRVSRLVDRWLDGIFVGVSDN